MTNLFLLMLSVTSMSFAVLADDLSTPLECGSKLSKKSLSINFNTSSSFSPKSVMQLEFGLPGQVTYSSNTIGGIYSNLTIDAKEMVQVTPQTTFWKKLSGTNNNCNAPKDYEKCVLINGKVLKALGNAIATLPVGNNEQSKQAIICAREILMAQTYKVIVLNDRNKWHESDSVAIQALSGDEEELVMKRIAKLEAKKIAADTAAMNKASLELRLAVAELDSVGRPPSTQREALFTEYPAQHHKVYKRPRSEVPRDGLGR